MLTISEEALMALVNNKIDANEIVSKLVSFHPEIFLKLLHLDDLVYQIQLAYGDGNMVAAIKKYRALTGTGLKDAKLAIEEMFDKGIIRKIPNEQEEKVWLK
jgi:hypothetical protein